MLNNPISSDLIRGHIDTIVLHALTKKDMHAQQISDFIEEKSENQYKINQATLYSSLKRLVTLKYISSYYNDSDTGRRKFFHILDKGVQYTNENLSVWSESKTILDKLMDLPTERVVYVSHNNTQNSQETTSNSVVPTVIPDTQVEKPIKTPTVDENTQIKPNKDEEKPTENVTDNVKTPSDEEKEINFRAVLNSLIKTTERKNDTTDVEDVGPEPLNIVIFETESPTSKLKFNETISVTDYNAKKTNNDGKIDFGDLTIKAEKEGYKIRISSKDVSKPSGFIFVNKLKFVSSLIIFILSIIEYGLFSLFSPQIFSTIARIVSLSIITIIPIIRASAFLINKNKKSAKAVTSDSILICAIVLFNLILVNLAVLFILDVDLSVSFNLISYFIVPICVYFDALIYFIVKNLLAKSKKFRTK